MDRQGLERAELVAQRDLVERVALKVRLEASGEYFFHVQCWELLERAALAFRHGVVALANAPQREHKHERCRDAEGEGVFDFSIHAMPSLKAEIEERVERPVH